MINPYRLPVEMDDGNSYTDAIVNLPEVLTSYTKTRLEVKAKLISAVNPFTGSEVQLVNSAEAAKDGKKAFIFFEFVHATDDTGSSNDWDGEYHNYYNQLVAKLGTTAEKKVMTLDASDGETPVYGAFRAFGAAGIPKTGMWTDADTVNIQVAFTFTMVGIGS